MSSKLRPKILLLILPFLMLDIHPAYSHIVLTWNGLVRGSRETTQRNQVDFVAYRGIPYAKTPVGDLRFKPPQPADSWKPNILDAFRYGNNCIGTNFLTNDSYPQTEDCLYLNIYVPVHIKPFEKLPVMFFIHGGGFIDGSGRDYIYGPDFLMESHVILVTINYRLTVLGFLSLDMPEYSGNMGLKDQLLALKWIHKNINRFGGDKKRITVFGQSAGGSSTHYHLLSAESRKYFHRAIEMSGTAYNPFALSPLKNHIDLAYAMADQWTNSTDCTATCKRYNSKKNLTNLVEVLKVIPVEIVKANMAENITRVFRERYSPVYERLDAVEPFLVRTPNKTYDRSIILKDVMLGITSQEILTFDALSDIITNTDDLQRQFDLELPFRGLSYSIGSPRYRALDAQVRQFYYGDLPIDSTTRDIYFTMLSDVNFVHECVKAAKINSQKSHGKTFFYLFGVESKLNVYKRMSADQNFRGAAHRDDLCYLFRCKFAQQYYDEIYRTENDEQSQISLRTIDRITKIFTDFAKYGQPLINNDGLSDLPQFEPAHTKYLDINNDGLAIGKNFRKKSVDFWENIEAQAYA